MKDFDRLVRDHERRYRVTWRAWFIADHVVEFTSFNRAFAPHGKQKGAGARALEEVCMLADQLGVQLELSTYHKRLHVYYEAFGFMSVRNIEGSYRFYVRRPGAKS